MISSTEDLFLSSKMVLLGMAPDTFLRGDRDCPERTFCDKVQIPSGAGDMQLI